MPSVYLLLFLHLGPEHFLVRMYFMIVLSV